jgi:hypothetical protein
LATVLSVAQYYHYRKPGKTGDYSRSHLRRVGDDPVPLGPGAAAALDVADYGQVLENGCIALHGAAEKLKKDSVVRAACLGGRH